MKDRDRLIEIANEVEEIAKQYAQESPPHREVHTREMLRYDLVRAAGDIRKAAKRMRIRAADNKHV